MKREVKAGVNFFKRLAVASGKLDDAKAQLFAEKLQKLLLDKFEDHWYPDSPNKGQAFRCIRINKWMPHDEALLKACEECELTTSDLSLPPQVTVWIDPLKVCARSGENSHPFTVACFSDKEEGTKEEKAVLNLDTSDYHSATSSDCGSAASSDTEEETKSKEKQEEPEKEKIVKKAWAMGEVIPPLARTWKGRKDAANKFRYSKNMVPANPRYFFHPAPMWPHQYQYLPPVCTHRAPPQPQVFGFYVLPQPPPHFILPLAALH
ncbi:maternal B9.15 protein [Nerophis ophidion]|uniref:maternal B9.15 protein n=1 Tax=Nerophis ophidion TaxID=159077 RepID=UPI002AE09494|nr:maternal B9.15 protein [Nerophis ophidion]